MIFVTMICIRFAIAIKEKQRVFARWFMEEPTYDNETQAVINEPTFGLGLGIIQVSSHIYVLYH